MTLIAFYRIKNRGESRPFSNVEAATTWLAAKTYGQKAEVVVKADVEVKSSEILKIMSAAQAAEYSKLIVAGEPLTKKEQNELASKQQAQTEEEQPKQRPVKIPSESEWEE